MKRLIKQLTATVTVITAITFLFMACNFEFEKPGEVFIPVESIIGVPTGGVARYELVLARSVLPDNATNKTVTWSVTDDGGTDTVLIRNILTAQNPGTIRVSALVKNGKAPNTDYVEDFQIIIYHEDDYVRVTSISGVPEECGMGGVDLSSAYVKPLNAVNKTIIWEVKDARETGAQISGNMLTTTALGTVVITARVANGKSPGVDFIRDFTVTVITPAVKSIIGVLSKCYAEDSISLSGTVLPPYAPDTIIWTIQDAGTTGAVISGNTLTVTALGTLVITAKIVDGKGLGVDYIQDFTINVLPPPELRVYVAGFDDEDQACYWRDGVKTFLPLPSGHTNANSKSYAISIIEADGSVYIAGIYRKTVDDISHPCYWKDGRLEFYDNGIRTETSGIAVAGGDVYMSGFYEVGDNLKPCYWKNGTRIDLEIPSNMDSGLTDSIAVADSTVYVGGYYYDIDDFAYCYWKITGGVQSRMTYGVPPESEYFGVDGSTVLNGDMYAVGYYYDGGTNIGCYWKNGVYAGNLSAPDDFPNFASTTIHSVDGALYIGGEYGNSDWSLRTGCYWKWNGTSFGSSVSPTGCTSVIGVSAYDGKVYVVGQDSSGPCYWADGTRKDLSGSIGAVSGIAAVWE